MKSDKKIAILMTVVLAASVCAMIPAIQAQYPEPDLGWPTFSTGYDIPDLAVGDLTLNGTADIAFIDYNPGQTVFAVYGNNGTEYWHNHSVYGYSIAVGDIDGDTKNEVVAGGYNTNKSKPGITVFENDGTVKFFYETNTQRIKDIELGDLDGDNVADIVACNNEEGDIYAFNGTGTNGSDLTGWPKHFSGENFMDIALGNLDRKGGLDVAILSDSLIPSTLYVYNSTGDQLWMNDSVRGRSVEIGDVDGDTEEEVVIGDYESQNVLVYDGDTGDLEYSFSTNDRDPTEVELGDLDDDDSDVEIAVITGQPCDTSLFAIDINATGQVNELWNFSIEWDTGYYGEGLAIGDVDRDYKNEVIAASGFWDYPNETIRVYAFDGLDSNDDGDGDVVWMYETGCGTVFEYRDILDVEVGDVDGDGDMDVIVGTERHGGVYALFTQEHTTEVGGETIFFDSDPSNITEVASVLPMPPNPPEGYNFPYGVFAINITVPVPGQWAIITITLPDDLPANAEYWKYSPNGNGSPSGQPGWYQIPLESNDGDNIIVIRLQDGGRGDADGVANGVIVDQGGPAIPPERVPALPPLGIVALIGLLSLVATSTLLKRRKRS